MSRNSGAMASSAGGGRGRLSLTGMIDFTRPGRLVKTTTMSDRKIASCRSWVTNSTVRLLRSHTERNSASFDQLVSADYKRLRKGEAQRFRGLEIEDQLEFRRLL